MTADLHNGSNDSLNLYIKTVFQWWKQNFSALIHTGSYTVKPKPSPHRLSMAQIINGAPCERRCPVSLHLPRVFTAELNYTEIKLLSVTFQNTHTHTIPETDSCQKSLWTPGHQTNSLKMDFCWFSVASWNHVRSSDPCYCQYSHECWLGVWVKIDCKCYII